MTPLRIFIGYDSREPVALHVLAHSILRRASQPVSITPVALAQLGRGLYTRLRGPAESTEFSLSRFLVPHLSGYQGVSIFMDCDMVCLTDIHALAEAICWHGGDWQFCWACAQSAVWVCQHTYTPKTGTKFLGQVQTTYPRKNWSSLMVFNNARCRVLTPEYVNTAPGLALHRFQWLADEEIGTLPLEWNWLVGEYEPNPTAKILHYTLGGPWFPEYRDCDHAKDWLAEREALAAPWH